MLTLPRAVWLLLALVPALTLASVISARPGVNSDPGWGIVAAEQFLSSRSPSPMEMREADPSDLSRDHFGRVSWWPPSYQLVPLAFRAAGLDWGNALRATFVSGWIAGALGWGAIFAIVLGPTPLAAFSVGLLLLLRFSHADAYIYSGGEFLLWAIAPYVVLINIVALRRSTSSHWTAAAGLLTPWLFLVKFNGAFLILGIGLVWTMFVLRRWIALRTWAIYAACGSASAYSIHLLGFPSGTTTFNPDVHLHLSWTVLWPLGGSLFAATDWDSLLRWLFQDPSKPILTDGHFEILYAVASLPVLVWVWKRARELASAPAPDTYRDVFSVLAPVCLVTSGLLLAFVSAESRSPLIFARYLRIESLMVLPFALATLYRLMAMRAVRARATGWAAFVAWLIVPALYGGAALVDKGIFRAHQSQSLVGPFGIRYDSVGAGGNVANIVAEIRSRVRPQSVLYLPSPDLGLAFLDYRFVIRHADFISIDELSRARFDGRPAEGVVLVLPQQLRTNGKLSAIENSFTSIQEWREETLQTSASWILVFGNSAPPPAAKALSSG
ncbi:MAG TPA: hypothetical protein VEK56_09700 [Vicinamibacterales bacterium]|nr:hypothetical protein [Vicinamibacterales bacterium]